jgi:hypothetical protein
MGCYTRARTSYVLAALSRFRNAPFFPRPVFISCEKHTSTRTLELTGGYPFLGIHDLADYNIETELRHDEHAYKGLLP